MQKYQRTSRAAFILTLLCLDNPPFALLTRPREEACPHEI